jgi:hypothetical protein
VTGTCRWLTKRGVKREVITPLDAPEAFREEAAAERKARKASEDSALVRALGLAHYWQTLLDSGKAKTPADIARLEAMNVVPREQRIDAAARPARAAPWHR